MRDPDKSSDTDPAHRPRRIFSTARSFIADTTRRRRLSTATPADTPPSTRTTAAESVAVLIDAENVAPDTIDAILATISSPHTDIRIRRAYGDWSRPNLTGWREPAITHAIRRIDALAATPGKNTADHALVADAIHLAFTETLTTIALVSSDADFADLAIRLREYGLRVHGYGRRRTRALIHPRLQRLHLHRRPHQHHTHPDTDTRHATETLNP